MKALLLSVYDKNRRKFGLKWHNENEIWQKSEL